jgi:hypothetical protein
MSKVVDGPYKLGVAMATVRGRAAMKAAVGNATIEPLQVGRGDGDSKREGGGESSCRNCSR